MIQHRYAQFSTLAVSYLVRPKSPTGNGFGCSNLKIVRLPELVSPITSSTNIYAADIEPVGLQESSPLIVEVGKIALLVCWFWCAIGANFCLESISAISTSSPRNI